MVDLEELLCVQPKKFNWTLIGNEYVDYKGPAWYDKQTGERVLDPKPYEMYDLVYVDAAHPDCNPSNVDVIELEVLPNDEIWARHWFWYAMGFLSGVALCCCMIGTRM